MVDKFKKALDEMGVDKFLSMINEGSEEYKKELKKMTDSELYHHCFDDGDFKETDTCIIELKGRGLSQFRPCNSCQGGGCPVCNGFGELSWF